MKKATAICATFIAAISAAADVGRVDTPPAIDGTLDEACWAKADWNGGFSRFAIRSDSAKPFSPTEFAILADAKTIYIGVKCFEQDMAAVRERAASQMKAAAWSADGIEVFLCPTGKSFDFYQFAIPYDERIPVELRFASEGGNIAPDPYAAEWRMARGETEQGWFAEIAIPLSSFYMTRNGAWSGEWLVNVARSSALGGGRTSWSPLEKANAEPEHFRKMKGFPARAAADDVGMTDFVAEMSGKQDGKIVGTLSFVANVALGGKYEVTSPFTTETTMLLKPGENIVRVPCAYPDNGRHATRMELKRMATGETYARWYPVVVDFEEIRLALTSPEYRDNFYPGQDASRVRGRVRCAVAGEVAVTLEGPGFPKREARLPDGGGEIDFDTRGFQDGTAVLTVSAGTARSEFKIRKLAKTGRRMAWISKGRLIVDGKPVLRRDIYAKGYRGGAAFDARFAAEGTNLFLSSYVTERGGTLEPERVIKGLGAEARKDVVPCKAYFDKIDAMIEKSRDKDFVYWYISDEPECRGVSPVYLRHIYEHMKEKDPYHVILTASRAGKRYINCADWFDTHPYLCPYDDGRGNRKYGTAPGSIGAFLDAFGAWNRPDKCIGFIPTLFSYRSISLRNDYPTFAEYVCHVWAAMVRGGKTLRPYAYHDMGDRAALFEGNRYVNSTFAALDDFILYGKLTTLLRNAEAECARWDMEDGKSMFALVNFTPESRTVAVPGLKGTFHEFRGDRTFVAAEAERGFAMKPFEVLVGTTDWRGEGLPTYAETSALVDRMEYERTHRDNQLLEKYAEVGFASSGSAKAFYKLIDGVRDVLAWGGGRPSSKGSYVEFSFPDRPLRFSKVRVYGFGLDGMGVSIRRGGEWKSLEPRNVTTGEWMRELDFGAVEATVKIRISFPKGAKKAPPVELYEVEIPAVREAGGGAVSAQSRETRQASDAAVDALWTFDGSNAEWSDGKSRGRWKGGKTRMIEPRPDGGFKVSGTICHLVKLHPDYPWLEIEADSFAVPGDGRKYRAWSLHFASCGHLFGTVTHPQAGLYTVRMPKVEKAKSDWLKFYDYNLDIGVRRLRNVKRPPNLLSAEVEGGGVARPGARLRVRLELEEPCEDVTAVLLCDRRHGSGLRSFAVNGTNALEMKATDESGRRWEAVVDVRKCDEAEPRQVYVRCLVLGGALKTPVFTNFTSAFSPDAPANGAKP